MRQIQETYRQVDWPRKVAGTVKGMIANIRGIETRVTEAETAITAAQGDITALETATNWAALADYVDDAAAAAGGVPVGALYRNGSVVMVRVA